MQSIKAIACEQALGEEEGQGGEKDSLPRPPPPPEGLLAGYKGKGKRWSDFTFSEAMGEKMADVRVKKLIIYPSRIQY